MINAEDLKRIKKYAMLRGKGEPAINYKLLRKIYENAPQELRVVYSREMNQYFNAYKAGKVKRGQSILHVLTG